MKLITRDTDYAIRAVSFMAGSGGKLVTAADLHRTLAIPRPFLRKILQALGRAKILSSCKGKGGGFWLTSRPENISIMDIIETFHGKLKLYECFFRKRKCRRARTCKLRKRLNIIEKHALSELRAITISSIM